MSTNLTTFGYTTIGSTSLDGYDQNPATDDLNMNTFDINNVNNLTTKNILATSGININTLPSITTGGDVCLTIQNPQTNKARWIFGVANPESGNNAGCDFNLWRYDDGGNFLGGCIYIVRGDGHTYLSGNVQCQQNFYTVQNASIGGNLAVSGSISSTGVIVSALNIAQMVTPSSQQVTLQPTDINKIWPIRSSTGMTVFLPDPVANNIPIGSFYTIATTHASSDVLSVLANGVAYTVPIDTSKTFVVAKAASGGISPVYVVV